MQITNKIQNHARRIANELVRKREEKGREDISLEFSDHEIEDEFQKFWSSIKDEFNSKKEKTFIPDNVPKKFYYGIGFNFGHVAGFKKVSDKFGVYLQNKFKIEWVNFSHVEFIGNILSKYFISKAKFYQNMRELIVTTESKLLSKVIGLCDIGGLMKMHFQPKSAKFDCGTLINQYLIIAADLLEEAHNESPHKTLYNLTDTFKVMFLFHAAKLAVPNFVKAQQSFIDYMDISTKIDMNRENIKQMFTLALRKEETLTIAAKQITKQN